MKKMPDFLYSTKTQEDEMLTLEEKLSNLKDILFSMKNLVVAFSGGVDSALLLKIAGDVLKNKAIAVIAKSPTYPKKEITLANNIAKIVNINSAAITA